MNEILLSYFKNINPEEQRLLEYPENALSFYAGKPHYTSKKASRKNLDSPLTNAKPITVYKHPRFVEFPNHTHEFMEMIYIYSGSIDQVINETTHIHLETDDLLFLSPGTSHAAAPAGYDDIAIHIQINPEYLSYPLQMLKDDTYLRRFLRDCMMGSLTGPDYLHFHLKDILEAKNLMENMMLTALRNLNNSDTIVQATLGVLLMELLNRTYRITVGSPSSYEQEIVLNALAYIEENYQSASLEEFASSIRQPPYFVSRLMKKYSPYTFTTYLQRKRLFQACYLLTATTLPIEEISQQIGYENSSYFHRLFKKEYNMTPRQFRTSHST